MYGTWSGYTFCCTGAGTPHWSHGTSAFGAAVGANDDEGAAGARPPKSGSAVIGAKPCVSSCWVESGTDGICGAMRWAGRDTMFAEATAGRWTGRPSPAVAAGPLAWTTTDCPARSCHPRRRGWTTIMITRTSHTTGTIIDAYQTSSRRNHLPQPSGRPSARRSTRIRSHFAAGPCPRVAYPHQRKTSQPIPRTVAKMPTTSVTVVDRFWPTAKTDTSAVRSASGTRSRMLTRTRAPRPAIVTPVGIASFDIWGLLLLG